MMISVLGVFNADLKFLVERFPTSGETLHGLSFEVQPGGKGFNQAISAARASQSTKDTQMTMSPVAMLTQLGEDNFAELAMNAMEKDYINTTCVLSTGRMPTGTAMILVEEKTAANMIVVAPGAASILDERQVLNFADTIANSSMFLTNFEVPMVAACAGIRLAHERGVAVLLDPAPASAIPDVLYSQINYITPNESEASHLVGFAVTSLDDAVQAGKILCARGVETSIITMAEQGVVAVSDDKVIIQPALKVEKIIDTTGAGDAFNGCFATAISEGAPLPDALNFGAAGAALCVGKYGACDAMAHRSDIDSLLSNQPAR